MYSHLQGDPRLDLRPLAVVRETRERFEELSIFPKALKLKNETINKLPKIYNNHKISYKLFSIIT